MNIYVVPEIDIERFKETGVFAVQLLNNEAMAHDAIYLESDRAKEFAEFFKDNIFPAEKFEELVEWGIKADAESASLVRAIIHSRVWEYEQKRAMTMDQVLVQLCMRQDHVCADGYVQHHEQCPRTHDEGLGNCDRRPWPQARPLPGVWQGIQENHWRFPQEKVTAEEQASYIIYYT